MSRDPQLNHTSFSLLISCNKNISAQKKKFKDLHLKITGLSERKIFSTLLPSLLQVCRVRLCLLGVLLCHQLPSRDFEGCALIQSLICQVLSAGLAVRGAPCNPRGFGLGIASSCRSATCWESSEPFHGHWALGKREIYPKLEGLRYPGTEGCSGHVSPCTCCPQNRLVLPQEPKSSLSSAGQDFGRLRQSFSHSGLPSWHEFVIPDSTTKALEPSSHSWGL